MSRILRKNAISLSDLLQEYIKDNHLSEGINRQRVFSAWNEASGAEHFTIKKFYRDGTLYITISSSVVRSQLQFQKKVLTDKINYIVGSIAVKELIIK